MPVECNNWKITIADERIVDTVMMDDYLFDAIKTFHSSLH